MSARLDDFKDAPRKDGSSWDPINLSALEDRPPIRPELGDAGFVYPRKRHVFSGEPESGKTIAAYAVGLAELRAGGRPLVVDFEMGRWDARTLFRDLGARDEELEWIVFIEPETPADADTMPRLVDAYRPTLAIVDAAAGAYDLQGLDDNKRADTERFVSAFVRPLWRRDVASIILDHVGRRVEGRGRFAIGSERKVGGADVHLGFEIVRPLFRGGRGTFDVVTHKDRGGYLSRPKAGTFEIVSDPETHALSWSFEVARHEPDAVFRPTTLMERVSRFLEGQTSPVSRTTVEEAVKGKVPFLRVAMDRLVAEEHAREIDGPRRARLIEASRPFRDADDPGDNPSDEASHGLDSVPERQELFQDDSSERLRPTQTPGVEPNSRLRPDSVPDSVPELDSATPSPRPSPSREDGDGDGVEEDGVDDPWADEPVDDPDDDPEPV